jgi:hypothetical protein
MGKRTGPLTYKLVTGLWARGIGAFPMVVGAVHAVEEAPDMFTPRIIQADERLASAMAMGCTPSSLSESSAWS